MVKPIQRPSLAEPREAWGKLVPRVSLGDEFREDPGKGVGFGVGWPMK